LQIKVGELEVLESGTVHSRGLDPIEFVLAPDMTVRLLVEREKGAAPAIELTPFGATLTMKFVNPDAQLHFGPQAPVLIGKFQGRDLFCMLRINTYGDFVSYGTDYTFYLGRAKK
jgi:hypothetical protein